MPPSLLRYLESEEGSRKSEQAEMTEDFEFRLALDIF